VIHPSFAVSLELARHVARMVGVTSNAYKILVGKLFGKRQLEIRKRWENYDGS